MSVQTATNRFMVPPKVKAIGFYKHLFKEVLSSEQLGNKLVALSEQARAVRHFDALSEYALILSNLPTKTYQTIGQFYLAVSLCRNGLGELDEARMILETVAGVAPPQYRAEAMISLSSIAFVSEEIDETLMYCSEASKILGASIISAKALRGIGIVQSSEGFHQLALQNLEKLYPIIKYAPAHIYLDYLNSLAVELGEVGRVEEASTICKVLLDSPYAFAYPEWRETGGYIALRGYKSRSSVSVTRTIPKNVLYLPAPSPVSDTPIKSERGRLFSLEKWKEEKMVKEPNGNGAELPEDMSVQDLAMSIVEMITKNKDDEEKLRKLFEAARKIFSEKK